MPPAYPIERRSYDVIVIGAGPRTALAVAWLVSLASLLALRP